MNCSSIPDYTHTLDLVVALGGIPGAFSFSFLDDYPNYYQSTKFQSKVMNNKKKNEGQTDFSYYGLYLLDYLHTNRFEQATIPPSSVSVPTVPPKRMNRRGLTAIPPRVRRSWR